CMLAVAALLFRLQRGMRLHAVLQKTSDDFNRKGVAASSIFEMARQKVSDAHTFGCADRRRQTSMQFALQRCLRRSCACATGSYLAGSFAGRRCVPAPSLCDRENVPRASVHTTARPPTAGGQLCMWAISGPLFWQ